VLSFLQLTLCLIDEIGFHRYLQLWCHLSARFRVEALGKKIAKTCLPFAVVFQSSSPTLQGCPVGLGPRSSYLRDERSGSDNDSAPAVVITNGREISGSRVLRANPPMHGQAFQAVRFLNGFAAHLGVPNQRNAKVAHAKRKSHSPINTVTWKGISNRRFTPPC
jgi:hypothetical protein